MGDVRPPEDTGFTLECFLSYGFRPFFLLAGGYAVLAMAAWIVWLMLHSINVVVVSPSFQVPAHLWHGHEMLFGYAVAAATGFMLTAVPNWTGTRPISGMPLAILAAVWLAGRLVMWFSALLPAAVVALVDMAHLPLLAAFVAVALNRRPAPRNLVFLGLLAMLTLANGAVHADWTGWTDGTALWGLELAVMTFTVLIVIVGGRVVPAFTRNRLQHDGEMKLPPSGPSMIDALGIGSVFILTAGIALGAPDRISGVLAVLAVVINTIRFSRWRVGATVHEPILWSLHLGYGFVLLGLAATALSRLTDLISQAAAMHILAIGAIGCMTLAIMTRAALGHTGRALAVSRPIAVSYGMISLAALARGVGPDLFPAHYFAVIFLAGALWIIGFAVFLFTYAPILIGPPVAESPSA